VLHWLQIWSGSSRCVSSIVYCISTVNTQHMRRSDVSVQMGYIWRLFLVGLRRLCVRDPGRIACCCAPNSRSPATKALHTICGNNTSIVSSSWWRAYKCPKHVEQIISAIKHLAVSRWFSSLRLYNDARINSQTSVHELNSFLKVVRKPKCS